MDRSPTEIIIRIALGLFTGLYALSKNRSFFGWGLSGFFFFIIPLFIVWILDPVPEHRPPEPPSKKCPDCAERVLAEAKKCKHCGHNFSETAAV